VSALANALKTLTNSGLYNTRIAELTTNDGVIISQAETALAEPVPWLDSFSWEWPNVLLFLSSLTTAMTATIGAAWTNSAKIVLSANLLSMLQAGGVQIDRENDGHMLRAYTQNAEFKVVEQQTWKNWGSETYFDIVVSPDPEIYAEPPVAIARLSADEFHAKEEDILDHIETINAYTKDLDPEFDYELHGFVAKLFTQDALWAAIREVEVMHETGITTYADELWAAASAPYDALS
jgi:hypothetical protein